jgi:hypothetical protein
MEEKTIRSVSPVPLALMSGAVSGVIAFVMAVLMSLFWLPYAAITLRNLPGTGWLFIFGSFMIIIMPIVAFVLGFIEGLIVAVVYNFLAPRIGGIKVRVEAANPPQS